MADNKGVDEAMDEHRKVELRLAEMYGILIRMHELMSITQTVVWILLGANAGVLLTLSVLLFK